VSIIVFLLLRLAGDPIQTLLPFDATEEARDRLRAMYGLDRSIPEQYIRFVARAARGDFGQSLQHRLPAMELVLQRYPNTLQLTLLAVGLGLVVGVPLGVLAAIRKGGLWDRLALMASMLGQSVPTFWLGILLIIIFAVRLDLVPTSGKRGLEYYILPTITLSSGFLSRVVLIVRSGMMEVLDADYVRTARSKGLGEVAVILRHVFRNTLIPLVTYVGMVFGRLLGGAVITETVFSWPGVGALAVDAIFARDYPLVQASVFTIVVGIAVINLVVDLCYGWLDPRISHS
jgi:peptide/nickel transport system permease protein